MLEHFTAYLETISREDAPHLHSAVEELCSKAGISKPELCFAKKDAPLSTLYRYLYDHMAAAMNVDRPRIILGEEFRKIMGHHQLDAHINDEFKAVIAHEIGHIKHGDTNLNRILPLRLSPHLGFVAGLAGIWLYDYFTEKKKKAEALGISPEEIHKTIHHEWKNEITPPEGTTKEHNYLATAANYLAGGLLGFGVGTAVFSLAHRRIEFRADRTSAELMGDGKPLIRALKTLETKMQDSIKERPDVIAEFQKKGPVSKLLSMLTHPSNEERIERLSAWSR